MKSVYIETTIPSYLTAWPARNLIAAAHQAITREWWALRRDSFHLFVSQLVITEASAVPNVCTPEELMGDVDLNDE